MRRAVELADVHDVVLIAQHSALVVVGVEVVGRAEQRDHRGEALGALAVPAARRNQDMQLESECAGENA